MTTQQFLHLHRCYYRSAFPTGAVAHLANSPRDFHHSIYGYYDHSHFYKHLRQFLQENTLRNLRPHIQLLELLHKN